MDAFYASVEQYDRPELKGQPVIVGGSSKRAVVCAASYEARKFGVRSAMPMYEARRRCPDGVYLPVRMARYREVSAEVFRVFTDFTPVSEGLSLDEAYLDLSGMAGRGQPLELGRAIKAGVQERTGLTASVGLGPNKLVAKIASDKSKPDGLLHIAPEQVQEILDPLAATALWGIGPRTYDNLQRTGIKTVRDLRLAPAGVLQAVFGRYAAQYQAMAAGRDERAVAAGVQDISISQETTFEDDLRQLHELEPVLRELTEALCRILQRRGLMAHTLVVKLRTADFSRHTRQRRFTPASHDLATLYPVAHALLARWLEQNPGAALRLLGVAARDFADAGQLALFEEGARRAGGIEA